MLRITKQTDYGIMLLAHFTGLPQGEILSARQVANLSGLTLPTVSKILKALCRGNVVDSVRGVGGGYRMTHPPEETTLASVIRALEGPISMVECGVHPGRCEQESICPTRQNWTRINRVVEQALERVPISHMVAPCVPDLLTLETDRPNGAAPAN